MKKNSPLQEENPAPEPLFREDFTTLTDSLPGSWFVEHNSDLPDVPEIRSGEDCIELLSSGNKFLPLIPEVESFTLQCTFRVNERSTATFGLIFCFSYDTETAHGSYLELKRLPNAEDLTLEYGTTRLNRYNVLQTEKVELPAGFFSGEMQCTLSAGKGKLTVLTGGKEIVFETGENRPGLIALARSHFFGLLKLSSLSIEGVPVRKEERCLLDTTVTLPSDQTHYPIYCDVKLQERGRILEADLTLRGSVPEYPVGEGNYHGIRSDLLKKPFLKVITKEKVTCHTLYNDTLILVPPDLVPHYFFEEINKSCPWPLSRKVRFMKPQEKFDLAVGFESYQHNYSQNLILAPAETIFDLKGNVLYSSLGLTDNSKIKVDFLSQEEKEILSRIPESDPRYERAVRFAKKNHYFMEGEKMCFQIQLTSAGALPLRTDLFPFMLLPARDRM